MSKVSKLLSLSFALVLMLAGEQAIAHGYQAGALSIGHPWIRATSPGAPTAAGYLTVTNSGATPDRLLGGATPAAERIEMHDMSMTGGVMRMRPVAGGLVIHPGQTLRLEPGGLHLMLVGPRRTFRIGDRIPATLWFERAGRVPVEFYVQATPSSGEDKGPMQMAPGMDMR